jgi:hypothetical protein
MGRLLHRSKAGNAPYPLIESVEVIGDYSLRFAFDDGYVGEMSFDAQIGKRIWKDIRTPEDFASVRLNEYGFGVFWGHDERTAPCALPADGIRFHVRRTTV